MNGGNLLIPVGPGSFRIPPLVAAPALRPWPGVSWPPNTTAGHVGKLSIQVL